MNPRQLVTPPQSSTSSSDESVSPVASSSASRLHIPTRSHTSTRYPRTRTRQQTSPVVSEDGSELAAHFRSSKRPRSSVYAYTSTSVEVPHFPTPALTPEEFVDANSACENVASILLPNGGDAIERTHAEAQEDASLQAPKETAVEGAQLLQFEKDRFVNGLVGASVLAIESIWGPSAPTLPATTRFSTASSVLPLDYFVREVLRRSRTSCSTLQLCLYYLHKCRKPIRDAVAKAKESKEEVWKLAQDQNNLCTVESSPSGEGPSQSGEDKTELGLEDVYPSPPDSPDTPDFQSIATAIFDHNNHTSTPYVDAEPIADRLTRLLEVQKSPLLCGRRMFLAALISASKYLQDRNYSNKAWSKISGLEIGEINVNERAFLGLIGWELHLKADDFKRWTDRLITLTTTTAGPTPIVTPVSPRATPVLLSGISGTRQGLARSSSEYLPAPASVPLSVSSAFARPVDEGVRVAKLRLALARGKSTPQLEFATKSVIGPRTFPIAQPIQARGAQTVPRSTAKAVEKVERGPEADRIVSPPRKVRRLPARHPHLVVNSDSSGVPTSWGAGPRFGTRVVGDFSDMISVH